MKKWIAFVCIGALLAGMTACGRIRINIGKEQQEPGAGTELVGQIGEDLSESGLPEDASVDGDLSAPGDSAEDEEEPQAGEAPAQAGGSGRQEEPEESASPYENGQEIYLQDDWEFADSSVIHSGCAVIYTADKNRKNIIVGVNAGHGTSGGSSSHTYCHPDHSAKVTGGSTAEGSYKATAVSSGMTFDDGTSESSVTLKMAQILRDRLLAEGYDVLMIRDGEDVQLDNIARTVICNQIADCHIALHWDGDGLGYDKGCYYCAVPSGIRDMYPVSEIWEQDNALGESLIEGLTNAGAKIYSDGKMEMDLTQTSYSSVPSVDIELGNQSSSHDTDSLNLLADGLTEGIGIFFGE